MFFIPLLNPFTGPILPDNSVTASGASFILILKILEKDRSSVRIQHGNKKHKMLEVAEGSCEDIQGSW